MAAEKHIKVWKETWTQETHETEYALKRIKSAESAKLTPIEINETDGFGYFQGGHGRYETFLDYCPCGDFRRSKLPCKHIYRLAAELGLMDFDIKHDTNSIPVPIKERVKLEDTVDLIETLSESAQLRLRHIAGSYIESVVLNKDIADLLASGILVDCEPQKHKINFGTKNEIMNLLDDQNIPYLKSDKKSTLEELCIQNIPQKAKQVFGELIQVTIPKKYSWQQIKYYLHRKLDTVFFFDENMNSIETSYLNTELPDDNVTKQLIRLGYYKPENGVIKLHRLSDEFIEDFQKKSSDTQSYRLYNIKMKTDD